MKKLLLMFVAFIAATTSFAQVNLTSGKTVVPLGGLKSFLPVGAVTEDNLQKITQDGNTDNVFLFPQNGENLTWHTTRRWVFRASISTLARPRVSVPSSLLGKVPTVVPTSM